MKLIEITNIPQMDTGAPMPIIIANDYKLFLIYYKLDDAELLEHKKPTLGTIVENTIIVFEFKRCLKHSFGSPSDETLQGHRFFNLGLKPYAVFEVEGSDMLEELRKINSVHPYYSSKMHDDLKHHIITFHDSTFECVAKGYEVYEKKSSIYIEATAILKKLFEAY